MNEHMDVTLMIADDESFILRGLKKLFRILTCP